MKNHGLWMIIGCIVPVILIFLLPWFGVSQGIALLLFVVLMFACHLMMFFGHGGHEGHGHEQEGKGGNR